MNTTSPHVAPPAEERPRVLLVDDDEVNLLLTGIALRERGFNQALEIARHVGRVPAR